MDEKRPKRRKRQIQSLHTYRKRGQAFSFLSGRTRCIAGITNNKKELFEVLNRFELDDLSILNEWDRHYEHSELTEISLYNRAVSPPESVEEAVFRNLRYETLHRAIKQLPEVQRRRLILYYFMGLTYAQIAEKEGCTFQAVGKSISAAEKRLKKNS